MYTHKHHLQMQKKNCNFTHNHMYTIYTNLICIICTCTHHVHFWNTNTRLDLTNCKINFTMQSFTDKQYLLAPCHNTCLVRQAEKESEHCYIMCNRALSPRNYVYIQLACNCHCLLIKQRKVVNENTMKV